MINEISDKTKLKITSSNFKNKVWDFPQFIFYIICWYDNNIFPESYDDY